MALTPSSEQLDEAVAECERQLTLCRGSRVRPTLLNDLAQALCARFNGLSAGRLADLRSAIEHHREALHLDVSNPHHSTCIADEALTLLQRAERFRVEHDGAEPHSEIPGRVASQVPQTSAIRTPRDGPLFSEFASLMATVSPALHASFIEVAVSSVEVQYAAFVQESNNLARVDQVISMAKDVIQLCPPIHPARGRLLAELAFCVNKRYQILGDPNDLEDEIRLLQEALAIIIQPSHCIRGALICSLVDALHARYESAASGDSESSIHSPASHSLVGLSAAIFLAVPCVQQGGGANPDDRVAVLAQSNNPAPGVPVHRLVALVQKFMQHKDTIDEMGEIAPRVQDLLSLFPAENPRRSAGVGAAIEGFYVRFRNTGDMNNLEQILEIYGRQGVAPTSASWPWSERMVILVYDLERRYEERRDAKDLETLIRLLQDSLSIQSPSDAYRALYLGRAANALYQRSLHQGDDVDYIGKSIQLGREALGLCSPPQAWHSSYLNILASALNTRFMLQGSIDDSDEALQLYHRALELCPPPDPEAQMLLINLANTQCTRFDRTGNLEDLDQGIRVLRDSLQSYTSDSPRHTASVTTLSGALARRFLHLGNVADIDDSIKGLREVLVLAPLPRIRGELLSLLAMHIALRFIHRGQGPDIEEAIKLGGEALDCHPAPIREREQSLVNLANCLMLRFNSEGDADVRDLEQCVELNREALHFRPSGHPQRSISLTNLGNALVKGCEWRGDTQGIDEAIKLLSEALELRPRPHPERSYSLNNLANAFFMQRKGGNIEQSLKHPIDLFQQTLELRPFPHPKRGSCLLNTAQALKVLHTYNNDGGSLDRACPYFEEAATSTASPPLFRFIAAKDWASTATHHNHPSALLAYQTAIDLLPRVVGLDLDLPSRRRLIMDHCRHLGNRAVNCAVEQGEYQLAVEMLEAARSVIWSQALHLRAPLDELRSVHPELAAKLSALSRKLEQSSFRDASRDIAGDTHEQALLIEAEALQCQQLEHEWDDAVNSVRRTVTGFEDFMRPRRFAALKNAAANGPVVVLHYGHALILDGSDDVHHVLLPEATLPAVILAADCVQELSGHGSIVSNSFLQTVAGRELGSHSARAETRLLGRIEGDQSDDPNERFGNLLEWVWDSIASPIIDSLKLCKSADPPRIWWCPTGLFAFLPIHAAGKYGSTCETLADYAVSSYTPTLTALLPRAPLTSPIPFKMSAIIQPNTPGHAPLPHTLDELHKIRSKVPKEYLTALGTFEAPASVELVFAHLETSSIVHFAGHAAQDRSNPLNSGLLIGEERVTVARIMEASRRLPDANRRSSEGDKGLVFLSACETSMGDWTVPDEVIHLAASLLFAGFRGVISTMWTMQDQDGPKIAEEFYGHLFGNSDAERNPSGPPDPAEAARALHVAIIKLRSRVPFARWVPFVHYGI
ncbi:CHAT domain-containing protein [Mycena latifolia]|nr:CHAT domain-containing protein [Mycena latifolia]